MRFGIRFWQRRALRPQLGHKLLLEMQFGLEFASAARLAEKSALWLWSTSTTIHEPYIAARDAL